MRKIFGGEQRGFVAAGAGADFEHHVLFVVGIFGQQQDLDLLLDARQFRLQARHFFFGHGAQFGIGSCSMARLRELVLARSSTRGTCHTTSERSLCALVTLRYWSASPITAGSAIWRVSSSKRFSSCSSFWRELHGSLFLGDDELAALGFFERHGAFQRADGDRGLLVGRRLGGDALQPQAGRGEGGQERAAALGREADQLVAEPTMSGSSTMRQSNLARSRRTESARRPASRGASSRTGSWCRSGDGRW
jgi:hypothetical protein